MGTLFRRLAFVYEKAGRMEDAIRVMRVRAATEPSRPGLQFDVVTALEMAGDAQGAAAASREFVDRCRKGLSEAPDDVMWKHALAFWYVMRPGSGIDGAEALRLIEQAARERPELESVQAVLGYTLYRTGQFDRAIEILEKHAGNGYDGLCYLAMSYWRAGRRDEALAT